MNMYGLYDEARRLSSEERTIDLSKEDLARQFEEGAFLMSPEEARSQGLLDEGEDSDEQVQVRDVIVVSRAEAEEIGLSKR